jgi:hypothetical protein
VSAVDCVATLTCEDGTSVSWNLTGCKLEVPEGMVEVPAGDYKACVDAGVCQYNRHLPHL